MSAQDMPAIRTAASMTLPARWTFVTVTCKLSSTAKPVKVPYRLVSS